MKSYLAKLYDARYFWLRLAKIELKNKFRRSIAIQEISKEYQRQKTNLCSPMDESARKPQQYLAEVGIMT